MGQGKNQPPDEAGRGQGSEPGAGYMPPPSYSHAPLEGPHEARPQYRDAPEQTYPRVLREGDIEVYPSYEAYLTAQERKHDRDVRGIVDEGADRTLAAVAHGAVAFGILGIGILVSLAISGFVWLYGKRSKKVQFHAEQAGCYQIIVLVVNALVIITVAVSGGFAIFQNLFGRSDFGTSWVLCFGLAFFVAWYLFTIGYGIYGAIRVLSGREFKYPLIGNWAKKRLQ
jgi:uncharacterized Tic20 family protein